MGRTNTVAVLSRIALVPTFTLIPARMTEFLARVLRQRDECLDLELGCQHFDVLIVDSKPNTVLLYEIYDNAEAIKRHREYEHYKRFKAETADMVAAVEVVEWTLL